MPDHSLRDALVEMWFDTDEDHHETATDEQILNRIEFLVGEGWHHAGRELDRAERLKEALQWALRRVAMPGCRCSTGSDGECTCDRESWPEFKALRSAEALVKG